MQLNLSFNIHLVTDPQSNVFKDQLTTHTLYVSLNA